MHLPDASLKSLARMPTLAALLLLEPTCQQDACVV